MTASRPYVLNDVFTLFVFLAAVLLVDVLATVFFAITAAYLLVPLGRRLETYGVSRRVVSLAVTVVAAVGVGVVLAPLAVILSLRLSDILELAALLPDVVTIELLGMVETVTLDDVVAVGLGPLRSVGHTTATAAPVILIKLTLFGFLVFALLLSGDMAGRTLPVLIPVDYRSAATTLNERAREALLATYVLQTAIAVGTFAIGLIVFWALGYDYVVTLTTVATVPQLIPIVGPSVLLAAMAIYHTAVGDVVAATLVVALLTESVDLLGAGLRVDDVGGDSDERGESANDSVDPSQP